MGSQQGRLERLREAIAARGEFDLLLVTCLDNVRYLSGFSGTNATLLIGRDRATLLTDFRYVEQAAGQTDGYEVVDAGASPRKRLVELIGDAEAVGFDESDMRVEQHAALAEELPDRVALVRAAGMVEGLRAVKDAGEIELIARAAQIADSIYQTLSEEGLVGRSERDVVWRIEELAHERGGDGLAFAPIVAAGAHAALPHAEPRDVVIEGDQLVVVDMGVLYRGYRSDCTRTFATGKPSEDQREAYELVRQAQEKALAGVRAGAECAAVDAIAREMIAAAGMGANFGHSLGHGVGIAVHELPTLSGRSQGVLEVGNVVTVEPGVYVEGRFGVRIEDLVVVEKDGPRPLTPFTKALTVTG